jgi:hypothetical protein
MNVCRECATPIRWAKTPKGVAIPLDRDPSPIGNILLTGTLAVKVPAAQLPIEDQDAYNCHMDTCTKKRSLTAVPDCSARCVTCGLVMDPELARAGDTRHPCC